MVLSPMRGLALAGVVVTLFLVLLPSCTAAVDAAYTSVTLAGQIAQDREGVYGTNSIVTPDAICETYSPTRANSDILIGAANYMFTLNRFSTKLSFFFGNPNATGTTVDWSTTTSASFGSIRLSSPIYSCVTTARTSVNSTIFYVANDRYVYTANPDTQTITATAVSSGTSTSDYLWDITIYNNVLYVLTTGREVYTCDYSGAITCTKMTLQGDTAFNNIGTPIRPTMGLAVSAAGIFMAPRSSLYWFNFDGTMVGKTSDSVTYIDAKFTRDGTGALMAASATALYHITISGSTLSSTLLTSTAFSASIFHIFPETLDSVVVTQPTTNLVMWTTYDNTSVATSVEDTPFPVGFVDATTVLPLTYALMDYELVALTGTIPYPSIAVNTTSVEVDDATWDTGFDVDVSNHYYTDAIGTAVQSAPTQGGIDRTLRYLQSYYNRTNEVFTGDSNLLPSCNGTKMTNIRHRIASDVRTLLRYPLIYTGEAYAFTANGQPNITLIKLLMPWPFGTYLNDSTFTTNATTPRLLATYDVSTQMVVYTRMNYAPSQIYDALFPQVNYPSFAHLTPEQEQLLRWAVYADALAQLRKCAAAAAGAGSGSGSGSGTGTGVTETPSGDPGSDMVAGCTPRVGIDNMTEYMLPGVASAPFNFTLFIPEGLYKGFNLTACLNQTKWTHVDDFNSTLITHHKKCDTGCIVGVAVASAVVAMILVVVIVIMTSKRRRLATVVVPMSGAEPKFTSTMDADSNAGSANPLAY